MQENPLPINPVLQVHTKLPSVLVQIACSLQPPLLASHSLTSQHQNDSKAGDRLLVEFFWIIGLLDIHFMLLVHSFVRLFRLLPSCEYNITVWTVVQTVLTATFTSYGNRQISTPPSTKLIPLNQSTKYSAQFIVSARGSTIPDLVEILSLGASEQVDELWQKLFFIYLYFFLWPSYRSDPWMHFFTRDNSKDKITQACAFLGL